MPIWLLLSPQRRLTGGIPRAPKGNGADRLLDQLLPRYDVDERLYKLRDDPRITAVGGWLRRWALDEVPQLWNVLRGEMSLVGPRPPVPSEVARYQPWHFDRLEVRPGLTGLWQVRDRGEFSFDECVRLDLLYIDNRSLAFDLRILAQSVPALLRRRGRC
jgi:lipopolysaccharide/colanic/teichoic acid biosynthesis glycosyltransferase